MCVCVCAHVACVHTIPHLAHAHQTGTVVGRRTASFTFLAGSDFTRSNTNHLSPQPRPTGCSREDHPCCTPGAQAQPRGHRLSVLNSQCRQPQLSSALTTPSCHSPQLKRAGWWGRNATRAPLQEACPGSQEPGRLGLWEGKLPKHSSQVHTDTLGSLRTRKDSPEHPRE